MSKKFEAAVLWKASKVLEERGEPRAAEMLKRWSDHLLGLYVEAKPCQAKTKKGGQCSIEALPNMNFCHVHEPSLQCGANVGNGKKCTTPTGGRGTCPRHTKKAKQASPAVDRVMGW